MSHRLHDLNRRPEIVVEWGGEGMPRGGMRGDHFTENEIREAGVLGEEVRDGRLVVKVRTVPVMRG